MIKLFIFHVRQHQRHTGFIFCFIGNRKQSVLLIDFYPFPLQQRVLSPEFIQHVYIISCAENDLCIFAGCKYGTFNYKPLVGFYRRTFIGIVKQYKILFGGDLIFTIVFRLQPDTVFSRWQRLEFRF